MNKILEGLEAALEYAKCDHDMIIDSVKELDGGRSNYVITIIDVVRSFDSVAMVATRARGATQT